MAQLPNVTSVSIPESITAITSDTFVDCPRLATITVAQNNPTYASLDGVLYNKDLTRILLFPGGTEGVVTLPDQIDAVPASALSHSANLFALLVGQGNAAFSTINGSLYSKDASTLVACPGGIGQTLTLPKKTTTIGPDALAGITTLKSIVVLGNITTIDPSAFNDQAKQSTTIALPGGEDYETRKQVWENAGFKNFATPANPGDTQTPDQPGEGTQPSSPGDNPTDPNKPASGFTYKLLEDYTLEASWTGELNPASTPIIPATAQLAGLSYTVSALAPKAFAGTALTTIDIPTTITTIGDQAFANCPNLTRIITHTNTIQVAPTALEGCTNLEIWCPYSETETYPWTIGLLATNNHIKAYGLPASQQALTLEVGQSASLFEPNTLQAPDPSKPVYAYEATCLSVSQEGTITAKAPGTTTISTSIELDQTPLTHTTRTISVVAPTAPTTPEQPEPPTPTPPNAQPITPRYPPNLATPTQSSAPLYSRGAAQPRMSARALSVTVPIVAPLSIDAAGQVKPIPKAEADLDKVAITSTATEPIRITKITCNEDATGAAKLLHKEADRKGTSVTVAENSAGPKDIKASMKLSPKENPLTSWEPKDLKSAPFRVNVGATLPITFGLELPVGASLSYNADPVSLASLVFTVDSLAPVAASLNLTSNKDLNAPKKDDILTATATSPVSGNLTYTWYALTSSTQPLNEGTVIKTENTTSLTCSFPITADQAQENKFICCQISNGGVNRPVASQVTGKVAAGGLNSYSWDALSKIAADLSINKTGSIYYDTFKRFMDSDSQKSIAGTNMPKVRIVGINHDVKSDGTGTAGLTFMATHSLPSAYPMNPSDNNSNTGGWKGSALYPRMQPNGDIWATLTLADQDLTRVIKPVKKPTNNVGGGVPASTVPTETSDYLWLPSYKELVGNTSYFSSDTNHWINKEGSQYKFFTTRSTTIFVDMGKTQGGGNPINLWSSNYPYWMERSCSPRGTVDFVQCSPDGDPSSLGFGARGSMGAVIGFCL